METRTVEDVRARGERLFAQRPDLSVAQMAAHTAVNETTVRHFFNGHGTATMPTAKAVDAVLEAIERGDILAPGGGSATVLTESAEPAKRVARSKETYITDTVRRVSQVLDYCSENASIGVITGTYGVGKTQAVKIWRRRQRNVASVVFEFDEFSARNKVEFMAGLAELLGVDVVAGPQYGGQTFRRVCEALRAKPMLLVFDQCESLSISVFQCIRQLWDRVSDAGVGIVLLAAPVLLARLNSSQAKDLGALTSRVGVWAPLLGMTRSEMADIVKREGITEVEEEAFDLWYRAAGGSMRRVMAAVKLLRAKHADKRVTEKTIAGVAEMLWGMALEVG